MGDAKIMSAFDQAHGLGGDKLLREYKDITNDKLVIERGSLSSGTYLLKIINNKGIRMKKLIIE